VDDPPTVDEVIERQREEYPEQAATSTLTGRARRDGRPDDADAASDAESDGQSDAESATP
jgi:hypothetical protein